MGPRDYESPALTAELQAQMFHFLDVTNKMQANRKKSLPNIAVMAGFWHEKACHRSSPV